MSDVVKPSLPCIAYVDEFQDERENFYIDAIDSGFFSEIYLVHPDDDLRTLITKIDNLRVDALVSDFNLSEAAPKSFNGADVVEAFLRVRSEFPCFIRTSWDEDAMKSSNDVNLVYSKNKAEDERIGRDLFKRVALQIDRHKARILAWYAEHERLNSIDRKLLTAEQIDRIVELDTALERHAAGKDALQSGLKRSFLEENGLLSRENQLVEEVQKLVNEIKAELERPE